MKGESPASAEALTGFHLLETGSGKAHGLCALTIGERGHPLVHVGLLAGQVAVLVIQLELEFVELSFAFVLLLLLALLEELPLVERKAALVALGLELLAMRHVATLAGQKVAGGHSKQQGCQENGDRYC